MPSSLLNAFRHNYPRGSLVSELLTIHDGRYLVRVLITVDGLPLSTGLAAQDTLEAAEDLATSRALERLGLVNGQQAPDPSDLAPALGASPTDQSDQPYATGQGVDLAATVAPLPELPSTPPPPRLDTLPQTEVESDSPRGDGRAESPPALAELEDMATVSVDLSDIIAQTDVELQRLGWGVNQGREFLEKTYGKRSRHDLTDEELLEFLLFLETQPTPAREGVGGST